MHDTARSLISGAERVRFPGPVSTVRHRMETAHTPFQAYRANRLDFIPMTRNRNRTGETEDAYIYI